MADNLMEEQQKQRGRGRERPFEKGRSGNRMTAIIKAAGEGAISPDEGGRLTRLVEIFFRAVETRDFERRLQQLENCPPSSSY